MKYQSENDKRSHVSFSRSYCEKLVSDIYQTQLSLIRVAVCGNKETASVLVF